MKAQEKVNQEMRKFENGDVQVNLTSHKRAEAKAGYEHLLKSFDVLYPDDKTPSLLLQKAVEKFCPKIKSENKQTEEKGEEKNQPEAFDKNPEELKTLQDDFDVSEEQTPIPSHNFRHSFASDSVIYHKLYIACPVCRERGKSPYVLWRHGDDYCGGNIYIGDNAYVLCAKCNKSVSLKNLKFNCSLCSGSETDNISFVENQNSMAMTVAIPGMMVSAVGTRWLIKCLENLGEW